MLDRRIRPTIHNFSDIPPIPRRILKLPNGIDVNIVDKPLMTVARMTVLADGGITDYPNLAEAVVMGATLCDGTRSMSQYEISDMVDFYGARLSGNCDNHYAGIDLVANLGCLDKFIGLLAEIANEPTFPQEAVESASRRIASNKAVQLERVSYLANTKLFEQLKGPGHPDSDMTMPEEFMAVTRDRLPEIGRKFATAPKHIFLEGNISDELVDRLDRTFGKMEIAPEPMIRIVPYSPESPCRMHIDRPEAVQSAVAMGLPAIGRDHPDYIDLRLAIIGLGGYFGSRLMQNIREEKGLTYGINAALYGAREGAYAGISAQCDPCYVDRVVDESVKEIERLASNPPRGEELERLRLNAWTRLASGQDAAFGAIEHYITGLRVGTPPDYFEQQLSAIKNLSADTIARMAAQYLSPENLTIVSAGPQPK